MSTHINLKNHAAGLRHAAAYLEEAHDHAVALQRENRRLTSELEAVKEEREGLNRDQTELAARVDELKAQLANQATVPRMITADELEKAAMTMHNQTVDTLWGESASECEADMRVMRSALEAIGIREEGNPTKKPVAVGDVLMADRLWEVPQYAVIIDEDDDPWKKECDGKWYFPGHNRGYETKEMALYEPFTVLSLPEEDA